MTRRTAIYWIGFNEGRLPAPVNRYGAICLALFGTRRAALDYYERAAKVRVTLVGQQSAARRRP